MISKIRILNIEDYDSIKKIFKITNIIDSGFKNYYLMGVRYKTFGYFIGDQLTEFVSIIENKEIPAWTVSKLFSKYDKFFLPLMQYIISYEEENKKYQFFTLDVERSIESIDHRYKSYLEQIVPCKRPSGFENIDHDVLEYQKYDDDVFIHLWVLKNEYRTF
jgi:hypothetical protein